jgi:LysM repeat protein
MCFVFFLAVLTGCRTASPAPVTFPHPTRWRSPTATPSLVFPTRAISLTPTPAPTPTLRTYTVREGDTFGAIAVKFGVAVDDLINANPDVNPIALPIGTVLVIPNPPAGTDIQQPSPTPIEMDVGPPVCYVQPSGGKWCLAWVANPGEAPVASVYVRFSLYASAADDPTAMLEEPLPLTVLPPGERTVAAAFFPPDQAREDIVRVDLVGAIRTAGDGGILPLTIVREDPQPLADGLALTVDFRIDAEEPLSANRLDAVLVLIDPSGRPVGFRILRIQGEWSSGSVHPLTLDAFLLAGEVDSYEFILQARREALETEPSPSPT